MEPNDNNPLKPQPTGGLKVMTIFIAVLALHVLVISGFALKSWLYPSNTEPELALDKSHKAKITGDATIGDVTAADASPADKTAAPATADGTGSADATTTADSSTASGATPDSSAASAAPATPAVANASAPSANSVITVPSSPDMPATPTLSEDASMAAANPPATAPSASGPMRQGPVVNPPDNLAPPAESTAAAADTTTPAAGVEGTPYTVKRGDSLARIAHRNHVAVARLRSANSLASDSLHIGQKLVIPSRTAKTADASETLASASATAPAAVASSSAPVAQPVQPSDGVTPPSHHSTLASALPRHTHKTAAASTSTHHLYTVVRGDTLTKIAKRYHTTTSAIVAANSLANAGRLSIGQKLHIPSRASHEAATAQQGGLPESESRSAAKGQLANYVQ